MTKKICIISGARSDYGLLKPVMAAVQIQSGFELQVIVTGMHLAPEFGLTYQEIIKDEFEISAKVEMLLSGNTPSSIVKSMGISLIGFADALERLQPDLLLVLGDRFETLCAAQAAMILRIPIAHIHGGETTEGAVDEAMRHSITKMSQIHFATTDAYKKRIIQMGEQAELVFNVGAPGLDTLKMTDYLSKSELEDDLEIKILDTLFLITYHPVTLSKTSPSIALNKLFEALEKWPNSTMIITYPNADPDSKEMFQLIDDFVAKDPKYRKGVISLGSKRYLNLMSHADMVIGNSSSGIIEAPSFGIPTINIGDRQKGRVAAPSVIHCTQDIETIIAAIEKAKTTEFKSLAKNCDNPYGDGSASNKIVEVLSSLKFPIELQKTFFDQ